MIVHFEKYLVHNSPCTVKMSSPTCPECGKVFSRYDVLQRHRRTKHPVKIYSDDDAEDSDDEGAEDNYTPKITKRYDDLNQVSCAACGQLFGSQEHLDHHLRKKKKHRLNQFPCMHCTRVFSSQKELDDHFSKEHKIKEKDLLQCTSSVIFHHPFTMIVAGPTRSGKTTWVARLLQNRRKQIIPTPPRVIYCFAHEQPMYNELKRLIPSIEFYDAMPTEEKFSEFSNSLVILDDMVDAVMNDSSMMKVFTERSHHQNISVIFMTQNIFHQGKTARTISLNTQYMVLFENARDRQQIKTLAKQMYPDKWTSFMDRFNKETKKPYGRMIVDLRPGILEKDRFLTDNDCPETPVTMVTQVERVNQHGEGSGVLEMNVENLKRILPFESGLQLDMNSSDYVLVPKSTYLKKMKIDTADVLQSIKYPEQREMIRRYKIAQNMLQGSNVNMNEYDEAFQDFSVLKNRQRLASIPRSPPAKRQRKVEVNKNDDVDDDDASLVDNNIDAAVVDALPKSQKVNAEKLIRLLRSHGKERVSWTPNGNVKIRGQNLRGVNIVDLVGDVVRATPSKSMRPQREQFLNLLAQANIPKTD